MEQNQATEKKYYTIDLMHIFKTILHWFWIVVIAAVAFGAIGFSYSKFILKPTYSSSVLLYVNNGSLENGSNNNITQSDINTSQTLVKTYTEILKNRTTLEQVAEKMGEGYSAGILNGMIRAGSSNNTEFMKVTVVAGDPEEAAKIANTVADVLPSRISEIIEGATMKVVDSAIPNPNKIAPNVSGTTVKFAVIGFVIAVLALAVVALLDDTVHDEEYILQNYNYPILAKIPNLLGSESKHYGYRRGKYYYTTSADKDSAEK